MVLSTYEIDTSLRHLTSWESGEVQKDPTVLCDPDQKIAVAQWLKMVDSTQEGSHSESTEWLLASQTPSERMWQKWLLGGEQ